MVKSCTEYGCNASYNNHKWGRAKAQEEGWFFDKKNYTWCPKHKPEWVDKWRQEKTDAKGNEEAGPQTGE